MDLKEYTKNASITLSGESVLHHPHETHMALGLVTEAAEIADVFKKNVAYGKEVDWVNVQEEVGDLMWYLVNLCNLRGWDLEIILEQNINKLKARYAEKEFSRQAALNRDLSNERRILEESGQT